MADAAITTILQSILTWFPLLILVNRALSRGEVAPYAPRRASLREPTSAVLRWFLILDHYNADKGSGLVCCCRGARGFRRGCGFVLANLGRAMLVAVVAYAVLIGPTIGILVAVGTPFQGDWVFLGRWDGAVFKVVWGAVLGLIMSPAIAWMWMLRAGWIVQRHAVLGV